MLVQWVGVDQCYLVVLRCFSAQYCLQDLCADHSSYEFDLVEGRRHWPGV